MLWLPTWNAYSKCEASGLLVAADYASIELAKQSSSTVHTSLCCFKYDFMKTRPPTSFVSRTRTHQALVRSLAKC